MPHIVSYHLCLSIWDQHSIRTSRVNPSVLGGLLAFSSFFSFSLRREIDLNNY